MATGVRHGRLCKQSDVSASSNQQSKSLLFSQPFPNHHHIENDYHYYLQDCSWIYSLPIPADSESKTVNHLLQTWTSSNVVTTILTSVSSSEAKLLYWEHFYNKQTNYNIPMAELIAWIDRINKKLIKRRQASEHFFRFFIKEEIGQCMFC